MANTEYFEYNNGIYPCPLCIAVGVEWQNDDFDEIKLVNKGHDVRVYRIAGVRRGEISAVVD